ncbi:GntR family transcriptional regulator [Methylocella sp. CPCC 101449]|jgi:DNA-binding GntR family transcriptional regulator|uniref:GntR family transcriptional regulator n=1 Tax=Methylocella sp. CPCC 101449 TaxID=2987531 RepID=UPI00288E4E32|nr:GntR family transcriptional regulator [Methylocella sp. CPCC 101449]MDT2019431.1 GntR family transcriptional regulator [Methylocella sp. CPCC 101449]HEV2573171.1 GntR family transcriptional regulator [Beijerinckiaceae bacterium]
MAATPKPKKAASAPKRRSAPATERKVEAPLETKSEAKSLVQQAYESIKERIINLHFLPGQYLNEAAICAQLKLGRTPVHQALQRLQMEGLVDVLPRKGIIVQPDSLAEIMKILDSRVTVEPELARSAARRVAAGEITADQLKRVMEIATATADEDPPDIAAFTANDRWFHREVAQMSGNAIMSDFARLLHERSTRFWYLNLWQTIDVPLTNRQHAEIAAAVIAGDGELAAQRMLDHIAALRSRLEKLQRMSPNAFRQPPSI